MRNRACGPSKGRRRKSQPGKRRAPTPARCNRVSRNRLECTRGRASGLCAVPRISVYSGERNIHRTDRNAPGYTSFHSCPTCQRDSRYSVRARDTIARCVTSVEHETKSGLDRKRALLLPGRSAPRRKFTPGSCEQLTNLLDIIIYAA